MRRPYLLLVILGSCLSIGSESIGQQQAIDYAQDIRPILSEACFQCHGPDDNSREADLRLDTQEGLMSDLGGYAPVIPGDAEKSELLVRILTEDDDELMPPPSANKQLTATQKELLVQWVQEGGEWAQHWAFVSPGLPDVPQFAGSTAPEGLTEIDRFVVSRMVSQGLQVSPPAAPYVLVRRIYLDLIGLPPSPAEAKDWVQRIWADGAKANEVVYQELVSHLLDSKHYGERWARRWLDLARYADTNGYEKDRERSIWPYRDWVIDALNEDMPFDQFTIEQLAGDMLPDATLKQRIATGFHRNTMLNEEGGIDPLEFRFHAMTDRVATTGTTWLGLTLECCQCHTHKYDPVSQTEYYQIMALLNNAEEPFLELPPTDFHEKWAENKANAAKLLKQLESCWPQVEKDTEDRASEEQGSVDEKSADKKKDGGSSTPQLPRELDAAFAQWLEVERANLIGWQHLKPTEATSNLPILTIQSDNSIFASGDTAKRDEYVITFEPIEFETTAIRLEAMADDRLPARGPGTTYYEGTIGDFFLTEIEATSDSGTKYEFSSASETYAKNRYGSNPVSAALALDGDVQTGWSVHDRQGEQHNAVFILKDPIPRNTAFTIKMIFGRHFASSLGRFRFSACNSQVQPKARSYSEQVASSLASSEAELSEVERSVLRTQFLLTAPELEAESEKIRKLLQRPVLPTTLTFSERPRDQIRKTFRHHRGEYLQPEEEVQPGVPEVFAGLPADQLPDRLSFAKWLVSPTNPLTARVVVNRQWEAFFGTGIVKTTDDFGLQGEPPSHPLLLDWLAIQFMDEDQWSVKKLHRRIVSSRIYRQASTVNKASKSVDPGNRLLSYSPRFRLDAEVLRDSLLVASKTLTPNMGGPPVRPPQPKGVTEVAYGKPKWNASEGEDRYRRSIYTFVKRTAPFAMYSTFDAPSGESCVSRRSRSNSPLQALTLLNDIMTLDLARAAARRCEDSGMGDQDVLDELFRSVLVRPPSKDELQELHSFFERQVAQFRGAPKRATDLNTEREPGSSDEKQTGGSDSVQQGRLAAWTATARVLFSLDETQTRE